MPNLVDEQVAAAGLAKGWLTAAQAERALRDVADLRRQGKFNGTFVAYASQAGLLNDRQAQELAADFDDGDEDSARDLAQMALSCPRCDTKFSPPPEAQLTGNAKCPACGLMVDLARIIDSDNFQADPIISAIGVSTSDGLDPFIGKLVGGCRLKKKLGQGGMGAVYLGEHINLQKERAVKILPPTFAREDRYADRFIMEARLAAQLEHRNIVQVYDVGREERYFYLVMQFVNGGSLARLIKKKGRLRAAFSLRVVEQVSEGLRAAHRQNIVHRDIKPDNILITVDGQIKVADFGLAKATGVGADLTFTGQIMGSPAYMSPEQCDGRPVDARSDLYSLGVSFYQMITGERPFNGPTPLAVMLMHQTEIPIAPAELEPTVPLVLSEIVMRLLEKRPEARYQDAETLLKDLEAARRSMDAGKPLRLAKRAPDDQMFGMLAIKNGLLTREQVGAALRLQKHSRRAGEDPPPLGEICLREGFLNQGQLNRLLGLQKDAAANAHEASTADDFDRVVATAEQAGANTTAQARSDAVLTLEPASEVVARKELEDLKTQALKSYHDTTEPRKALDVFGDFLRRYDRTELEQEARQFIKGLTKRVSAKYDRRGLELAQKTEFEAAISHFNTALEINPNFALAYNNRGIVFMRRGDLQPALESFGKAIELEPATAIFFYNRGNVLRKMNKLDEAMADYDKTIALDPMHDKAFCNRGGIHLTRKHYDEALGDFENALKINSRNEEALNGRGKIYLKIGDAEKALNEFQQLVSFAPQNAKAYNSLGEAMLALRRYGDAKQQFQRAHKLDQTYPDPLYNLAVLSAHDLDAEKAIALLKKAIKKGFNKFRRIRREPAFQLIGDNPEFKNLLAGMR